MLCVLFQLKRTKDSLHLYNVVKGVVGWSRGVGERGTSDLYKMKRWTGCEWE